MKKGFFPLLFASLLYLTPKILPHQEQLRIISIYEKVEKLENSISATQGEN